jgi:Asp-tRNA(Asn)/Glu-tRNA(Gln) amidotransferase C subunit
MSRYIDETLKMEEVEYSEAETEAASEAIGAMVDYVDLVNEVEEE